MQGWKLFKREGDVGLVFFLVCLGYMIEFGFELNRLRSRLDQTKTIWIN